MALLFTNGMSVFCVYLVYACEVHFCEIVEFLEDSLFSADEYSVCVCVLNDEYLYTWLLLVVLYVYSVPVLRSI